MGSGIRDPKRTRNNPRLEALEGRVVLSTFHAGDVAQLRADIAQVNNTSRHEHDRPGRRDLFTPHALRIQNAGNLTIQSTPGKGAVNLVGSAVDRVLEVDGGSLTLTGLSISGGGGVDQGAGILSQNASLTLLNSKVFSNVANQAGGGIFALGGALKVQTSSIVNNRASNSSLAFGGGIASWGAVTTVLGSTISENSVYAVDPRTAGGTVFGTGAGIYAQAGTLDVVGHDLLRQHHLLGDDRCQCHHGGRGGWHLPDDCDGQEQQLHLQRAQYGVLRRPFGTGLHVFHGGRHLDGHELQAQQEHARPMGQLLPPGSQGHAQERRP